MIKITRAMGEKRLIRNKSINQERRKRITIENMWEGNLPLTNEKKIISIIEI